MQSIPFGSTGITVSRLAFGTGSNGFGGHSKQTRLGMDGLANLLKQAYDLGVTFWDAADDYGSHPHVARALQGLPRERVQVLTKTMSRQPNRLNQDINRYLKELNTEYIDFLLLHCISRNDWTSHDRAAMEALSRLKDQGKVRAVGVSCHSFGALKAAAESPWTEVVMVRINPRGVNMDASPEKVVPLLQKMHSSGKAVFGMKIFGNGALLGERRAMLQYALGLGTLHAFSIGMSSSQELRENVRLVEEILTLSAQV